MKLSIKDEPTLMNVKTKEEVEENEKEEEEEEERKVFNFMFCIPIAFCTRLKESKQKRVIKLMTKNDKVNSFWFVFVCLSD